MTPRRSRHGCSYRLFLQFRGLLGRVGPGELRNDVGERIQHRLVFGIVRGQEVHVGRHRRNTGFRVEYQKADGSISNYYPDFIVRLNDGATWIVETKGREDLDDPRKFERLLQWCADAAARDGANTYEGLFVREEQWEKLPVKSFAEAVTAFE